MIDACAASHGKRGFDGYSILSPGLHWFGVSLTDQWAMAVLSVSRLPFPAITMKRSST
jgi:hypothetical protein